MSEELTLIETRFNELCRGDDERMSLVKKLLTKCRLTEEKLKEVEDDLAAAHHMRRECQSGIRERDIKLDTQQKLLTESRFALVLIDGDSIPFNIYFYQQGYDGGVKLSAELQKLIQAQVGEEASVHPPCPIVMKIYCNSVGRTTILNRRGILKTTSEFERFAEGFAVTPLAELNNVGSVKERADEKIKESENLDLFLNNPCCVRIFFAGCHDNGYSSKLRHMQTDDRALKKIVLLRTGQTGNDFKDLRFKVLSLDTVFRKDIVESSPLAGSAIDGDKVLYTRITATNPQVQDAQSGSPDSQSARTTLALCPTGAADQAVQKRQILYNADKQRLDDELTVTAAQMFCFEIAKKKVKNGKHCNNYHLLGLCGYSGTDCKYAHGRRLGPFMRAPLAQTLRRTQFDYLVLEVAQCSDTEEIKLFSLVSF
ncbi:MAG: hypothetical protein Q9159_007460 [Coniocarpon cinnabarinum]